MEYLKFMLTCRTSCWFGQRKDSVDTNNRNAAREVRQAYVYPA